MQGNFSFRHERTYPEMLYPSDAFRILSLYRFWNQVAYFFPYRELIDGGWKSVLREFIPIFLKAGTQTDYTLACLQLIARLNDSHANIYQNNNVLEKYRGEYLPAFFTVFIDDKLVIGDFVNDSLKNASRLNRGDIITHIEGLPLKDYLARLLPFAPASNKATQLRDIAKYILRGHTDKLRLTIQRQGNSKPVTIIIPRFNSYETYKFAMVDPFHISEMGHKMIEDSIYYINGSYKYFPKTTELRDNLKKCKGVIFDLRGYVSSNDWRSFANMIIPTNTPFAVLAKANIMYPGTFTFRGPTMIGADKGTDYQYQGKVLVLVNENTQSASEFAVMGLQCSTNVTVIGSKTAGADGNVVSVYLPGGITTLFSGIGVYYPNHTTTQRSGIRIDRATSPTIAGFKDGRDDVLERAISLFK